jgi:hypothetical protein
MLEKHRHSVSSLRSEPFPAALNGPLPRHRLIAPLEERLGFPKLEYDEYPGQKDQRIVRLTSNEVSNAG